MSYKYISPENLSSADSLGCIFKTITLQYKYANLSVLHSEVEDEILRCLSFDTLTSEAVYLKIPLEDNYKVNPSIVSRYFSSHDFDGCFSNRGPRFNVNYTDLFERDLMSSDLKYDDCLHLHLFGICSIYSRKKDVNNSVDLLELTSFNYPGSNFYRLERIYHGKRNKVLKTNEIILL